MTIQLLDGMPPVNAVAFDVVGTVFSLNSLRPRLASAGLNGYYPETWFASFLRDLANSSRSEILRQ